MRLWLVLVLLACGSVAAADAPASPRIDALTKKLSSKERGAEDAFWKQVASEGTPIIEDVKDPKGRLLVTFVYRGKADTKHVAAFGVPNDAHVGYAALTRLPNSSTFVTSVLVDPRARFGYWFAPGLNLVPPVTEAKLVQSRPLWRPDVLNKTPYEVYASLVTLPRAPAQPWLAPKRSTLPGEITYYRAKSKALDNQRKLAVYTPAGFATRGAKYPLVVMFDGPAGLNNLALPIVLDELIAAKKIPACVVLLIGNADRGRELALNDAFADFVAHDLVPWMRKTYHATSDPRLTVIAGISLGAIAASHAAARHPAIFGNVISQSGAYLWSPVDVEPGVLARDYANRPKLPVRFWIEAGTLETGVEGAAPSLLTSNRHFRDVLIARGYDVTYSEYVGPHMYTSWRGTLPDGLIALLGKLPKRGGARSRSPGKPGGLVIDGERKGVQPLLQRTAMLDGGAVAVAKLKTLDPSLTTEDDVNDSAFSLLELSLAKEALPIYAWNVERFPKSSNAHDSLGEAHYIAGDRVRALASYKQALQLDPKNDNAKKMVELLSN